MISSGEDSLLDCLQDKLFHCTGLAQFRQIQGEGFIRPNRDQRTFTFHKTEYSYGYSIGAVYLFDLKDQPLDVCRDGLFFKWSFHRSDSPVTIIMILDRQSLDDKLILNDAARTAKLYKDYIPYIEVWCKEDVPVSAVTACIVLCNVGQGEFSLLNGNHRLVALVDQKVNEFQAKYADAYEKEVEAKGVLENLFRKKALN